MLKYLLDTNIVIYVIKRRPVEVMGVFNENAGRMAISAITLSELSPWRREEREGGAEPGRGRGLRQPAGGAALHRQGLGSTTAPSAARWRRSGRPIGVNDLHIAAHARSEGSHPGDQQPGRVRAGAWPADWRTGSPTCRDADAALAGHDAVTSSCAAQWR
jgi:tRNA(fMet)-specific endonuclease VapC